MKRFLTLLLFFSSSFVWLGLLSCAAAEGKSNETTDKEPSDPDLQDATSNADGSTEDEPASTDPTVDPPEDPTPNNSPSGFDEYESSCTTEECTTDEVCQETRSGSACLKSCPGQPCPPGEGLVSYCDRQGGVICVQE